MQYRVRVFDPIAGTTAERTIAAQDMDAVHRLVTRDGQTVLSVRASRSTSGARMRFDVGLFCQELRTLLSSGMTLVEAIEVLGSKSSGARSDVLNGICGRLLEGKSLAIALESGEYAFPRLLVASIRASERSSRVEDALTEFVTYEQLTRELRRRFISAALYPVLVVLFGTLVCIFMLTYVVPRFAQIYDDFGHSLSAPTRALLAIARVSHDHAIVLVMLAGAALIGAAVGYRTGALRRTSIRLALRFSFLRYYLRLFQLAQIYQTLSMLLRGGYALSDALPLAQDMAWTDALSAGVEAASRAVAEGKRVSVAFASNGLTDQVSKRLLQVGERSGQLAKVMDIIATGHRQEFILAVERATRLIEPILLMVMGALVGAIIILMYAPVFELAGAM